MPSQAPDLSEASDAASHDPAARVKVLYEQTKSLSSKQIREKFKGFFEQHPHLLYKDVVDGQEAIDEALRDLIVVGYLQAHPAVTLAQAIGGIQGKQAQRLVIQLYVKAHPRKDLQVLLEGIQSVSTKCMIIACIVQVLLEGIQSVSTKRMIIACIVRQAYPELIAAVNQKNANEADKQIATACEMFTLPELLTAFDGNDFAQQFVVEAFLSRYQSDIWPNLHDAQRVDLERLRGDFARYYLADAVVFTSLQDKVRGRFDVMRMVGLDQAMDFKTKKSLLHVMARPVMDDLDEQRIQLALEAMRESDLARMDRKLWWWAVGIFGTLWVVVVLAFTGVIPGLFVAGALTTAGWALSGAVATTFVLASVAIIHAENVINHGWQARPLLRATFKVNQLRAALMACDHAEAAQDVVRQYLRSRHANDSYLSLEALQAFVAPTVIRANLETGDGTSMISREAALSRSKAVCHGMARAFLNEMPHVSLAHDVIAKPAYGENAFEQSRLYFQVFPKKSLSNELREVACYPDKVAAIEAYLVVHPGYNLQRILADFKPNLAQLTTAETAVDGVVLEEDSILVLSTYCQLRGGTEAFKSELKALAAHSDEAQCMAAALRNKALPTQPLYQKLQDGTVVGIAAALQEDAAPKQILDDGVASLGFEYELDAQNGANTNSDIVSDSGNACEAVFADEDLKSAYACWRGRDRQSQHGRQSEPPSLLAPK